MSTTFTEIMNLTETIPGILTEVTPGTIDLEPMLPSMTMDEMKARVQKGIALLDEKAPDWWVPGKVDLDALDMQYGDSCVLGQIYGDYLDGCLKLGISLQGSPYGFDLDTSRPDSEYRAYDRLWVDAISMIRKERA